MNMPALRLTESKKDKTWTSSDGTRYGRDSHGNWIKLGWQTGMSDMHIVEYINVLDCRIEASKLDTWRAADGTLYKRDDHEVWFNDLDASPMTNLHTAQFWTFIYNKVNS